MSSNFKNVKKFKIYKQMSPECWQKITLARWAKKNSKKKQMNADMIILCDHKMDTTNNNNNIFTLLIVQVITCIAIIGQVITCMMVLYKL
jgi:hypothetical protein